MISQVILIKLDIFQPIEESSSVKLSKNNIFRASIENSDETSTSSVKRTVMERKTEICVSEDLSSSFQLN